MNANKVLRVTINHSSGDKETYYSKVENLEPLYRDIVLGWDKEIDELTINKIGESCSSEKELPDFPINLWWDSMSDEAKDLATDIQIEAFQNWG